MVYFYDNHSGHTHLSYDGVFVIFATGDFCNEEHISKEEEMEWNRLINNNIGNNYNLQCKEYFLSTTVYFLSIFCLLPVYFLGPNSTQIDFNCVAIELLYLRSESIPIL